MPEIHENNNQLDNVDIVFDIIYKSNSLEEILNWIKSKNSLEVNDIFIKLVRSIRAKVQSEEMNEHRAFLSNDAHIELTENYARMDWAIWIENHAMRFAHTFLEHEYDVLKYFLNNWLVTKEFHVTWVDTYKVHDLLQDHPHQRPITIKDLRARTILFKLSEYIKNKEWSNTEISIVMNEIFKNNFGLFEKLKNSVNARSIQSKCKKNCWDSCAKFTECKLTVYDIAKLVETYDDILQEIEARPNYFSMIIWYKEYSRKAKAIIEQWNNQNIEILLKSVANFDKQITDREEHLKKTNYYDEEWFTQVKERMKQYIDDVLDLEISNFIEKYKDFEYSDFFYTPKKSNK